MKQVIVIPLFFAGMFFSGRSSGQRGNQNSDYNLGTVEVLKGEILKIDTVDSGKRSAEINILVKSGKENIPVHLGTAWYGKGLPLLSRRAN